MYEAREHDPFQSDRIMIQWRPSNTSLKAATG
jgi:hypothetical protein